MLARVKSGRLILLTGLTRGLGRALLDRFREAGHRVVGCGRDAGRIEDLRREVGAPHDFDVVDVSDHRSVAAWAERVLAAHGAPDLLVNNAATMNRPAPLWRVPADEFDRMLAVNVSGTANVVRAFVPAMIAREHGVIVNLSSGWGRSTSPEVGPYCTTKWAIEGFTSSLAQELPPGLAAVALNPGVIDTDMLQTCFGASASSYQSPQDWARTAVPFLLQLTAADNGEPLTAP